MLYRLGYASFKWHPAPRSTHTPDMKVPFSEVEVPKTSIQRIVRDNPEHMLVQKDAKLALTKATTIFIAYLTAMAASVKSKPNTNNKKSNTTATLTEEDMRAALKACGFGEWEDVIESKLAAYRNNANNQDNAKMDENQIIVDANDEQIKQTVDDSVDIDDTQPMDIDN